MKNGIISNYEFLQLVSHSRFTKDLVCRKTYLHALGIMVGIIERTNMSYQEVERHKILKKNINKKAIDYSLDIEILNIKKY